MRRLTSLVLILAFFCNIAHAGFGGFLQANTAVDVIVGPFIDDTDGKTAETGLTVTQAEVRLSKNGGNMAQKTEATSLTHDELGNYVCKLDTTDTNTEGILTLMVHESGALAVKIDYQVLAQAAYISLITAKNTGFMGVDAVAFSEDTLAANNLELQYDGTGIIGDNFPFTQAEGAAIGGGLAINTTMASVTVVLGSEQDLANTSTSDDSRWTGDDDASGAEFIFRCTPADTTSIPVGIMFEGYYDEPGGATNGATLQVYNFKTVGWDTIVTLTNASADEDHEVPLSHAHKAPGTGTLETVGYTIGDVLIKFKQDTTEAGNACLLIDHMVVGFVGNLVTATEIVDEWETQAAADPTGFKVNIMEVNGTGQTANDMSGDIDDVLTDTEAQDSTTEIRTLMTGADTPVAKETSIATAQADLDIITGAAGIVIATDTINADALNTDFVTEIWAAAMTDLAAGAPSATASVLTAINYLYEGWRNKYVTNTTVGVTEGRLYKNDGVTILVESNHTDDGTDFVREELGAED